MVTMNVRFGYRQLYHANWFTSWFPEHIEMWKIVGNHFPQSVRRTPSWMIFKKISSNIILDSFLRIAFCEISCWFLKVLYGCDWSPVWCSVCIVSSTWTQGCVVYWDRVSARTTLLQRSITPSSFEASLPTLSHAFFKMRSKSSSPDRSPTVHTIKNLNGHGGMGLPKYINSMFNVIFPTIATARVC